MLKKVISSILIITILVLWTPIPTFIEAFSSYAEVSSKVTTMWEYEYSGEGKTLTLPYKGIYQIEAYGAQGGSINNDTQGGNGSFVVGKVTLEKNTNLYINVGGQNGYNGGGVGNTHQAAGGGATDIRLNNNEMNNRIIVAAGGGGAYQELHHHTGSASSGGGCYTPVNSTCGLTLYLNGGDVNSAGNPYYNIYCPTHGYISNCHPDLSMGGSFTSGDVAAGKIKCSRVVGTTYIINCGKSEGQVITNISGKGTPSSNNELYQGSAGGGGGYYGGIAQYAGSNYTSEDFTDVEIKEGMQEGNGYVKITLLKSYADVELSASPTEWTNGNVTITVKAKDEVYSLEEVPYSWQDGQRTTDTTYTAQTNGTYKVNVLNKDQLEQIETIEITNIDKINPIVNRIKQTISSNKKQTTLTIYAVDGNATSEYGKSGIKGYAITRTNVAPTNPSDFQESNEFTVDQNGMYYAWTIDKAGNISKLSPGEGGVQGSTTLVKDLEIEVLGMITWNDIENKYQARVDTEVNLYGKVGKGQEFKLGSRKITAGQTSYQFQVRETNEQGERYTFRIEEKLIDGYENVYSQNNITNTKTKNIEINIENNLILPEYTSELKIEAINSPENQLLKNSGVKVTATIQASSNNRESVGVHGGKAVLHIDEKIAIDGNSITLIYEDGQGNKTKLGNDYTFWRNTITTSVGNTEQGISMAAGKLTVEMNGVLTDIGEYRSKMEFTGKLKDYRGKNTEIDLGTILEETEENNKFHVQYQVPTAKIELKKVDSITKEKLTDATFVLYEWNGTDWEKKEVITDENQDGIYTSKMYAWNSTTQGKYKIVEEGIPNYHKDLNVSMEYSLKEYHEGDYTITVDYDKYAIQYGKREPDDLDKKVGIVENEPWKLKAQIEKIDCDTQKVIQAETEFTIYEWNKEIEQYEEYKSYTRKEEKVTMIRREDKSYLTGEWLYYTSKNEGKYRIVETKAPEGYVANYGENGEKLTYDINLVESIESGNYHGQEVSNESILKISNGNGNEQKQMTAKRVNATLNVTIIDQETKSIAQGDATLVGAKYGIYAFEQINHADGITTRYEGEPGVLYKKGELVESKITNAEGKMTFSNLECGIYYVQMIEAPEGYVLDETKYRVDLSYKGEAKEQIEVVEQLELKVKKQAFQLYKLKENQEVLSNAGFSMYLMSDLSIVKEGKITRVTKDTYQLKDETAKGSSQLSGKQNEDGTYYIADLIDYYYKIDYTEENKEQLPGDNEVYHPYNIKENFVKDYSSNEEENEIGEIRTDSKGYMRSPELAYGEYIVLETSVPREQQVVKGFIIKVQEDNREAQELRFVTDKDFKTKIKIYTKDASTENTIVNKTASYVIKNEETGKYMTKMQWNGINFVQQGTIENPFETKEEGYFITPMELPIGKYILEEVIAPEGYIVNGKEKESKAKVKFEVASNKVYYMDHYLGNYIIIVEQEHEEVVGTITIKSKAEYSSKKEKGKEIEITYETKMMPNVEYDIYAAEDINSQDNQKVVRYQKGEKVTRVVTDEKGEATIENLPQGKYSIKQISKNGLYLEQEIQEVNISYQGQEIPVVFQTIEAVERVSKFFIKIEDEGKEEKMPDITIEIKDKDGKVVASTEEKENVIKIEKTKDGYYVEGLPVGEYEIQEIRPEGYKTIEAQTVKVENTQEKQGTVIKTRKLIFDVGIEKKLKTIIIDGERTNVENEKKIMKVEIKERKIPTTKLQLQYSIKVVNKGEVEAIIEKILDKIPEGFSYEQVGSANWKVNNQRAIYEEKIILQPGESKEIEITLRWNNNINNFGEKKNTAELLEVTNPYGYENRSKANGEESATASVVISVGTGLEEKITVIRMIAIIITTCIVISFIVAIEIAILRKKSKK